MNRDGDFECELDARGARVHVAPLSVSVCVCLCLWLCLLTCLCFAEIPPENVNVYIVN